MRLALAAVSLVALVSSAEARWKPEYASADPEVRAWYERQTTTPEWRKRVGAEWYRSCCDHGDTVEAEFKKDGQWAYRLRGQSEWHSLPDDVVQADVMTPGSKPVLFMDHLRNFGPICFFPGGTGT